MFKALSALVLLAPNLSLAAGAFNANLGKYEITARHEKRSDSSPEPMNSGTIEITEGFRDGHRYITYKVMDASGAFQEGGPLLTSAGITGDRSLRCEERANIINCFSSAGWSVAAIANLQDGKTILSLFNGGRIFPETIWELKRLTNGGHQ
jgi:hypothetical protein